MLMIELRKCPLWPEYESLVPKLDIDKLPALQDGDNLKMHLPCMFVGVDTSDMASVARLVDRMVANQSSGQGWPAPEDPSEAALHEARESIQILFVTAWQKVNTSSIPFSTPDP